MNALTPITAEQRLRALMGPQVSKFRRIERKTVISRRRKTALVEIVRKPGAKRGPRWKDLITIAAKEAARP